MATSRFAQARRSAPTALGVVLIALFATMLLAGAALAATPGKPTAKEPKGTITSTKPTFKWSKVAGAAKYEVRVYKGSKSLLTKTGISGLSWTSSKVLPKGYDLTWKVRGHNASGSGAWSKSLKFNVALVIGDPYGGGKVAYILQLGDPGYVAGQTHGLIAAAADQSTALHWYNASAVATGATATALGTGLANTNIIIAAQGATASSYAAGLARAYNGGGHTDWYLPSKDELNKLYENQAAIGAFDLGPGGSVAWGTGPYWSSSEYPADPASPATAEFAWAQYFSAGIQHVDYKSGADYRVRAVRTF